MKTKRFDDGSVFYELPLYDMLNDSQSLVPIQDFIGKEIRFNFLDIIHCVSCGVKTKKTFQGGLCYKCFKDAPAASPCVLKPELCQGHLGIGRDVEWEKKNHVQPHYVYLTGNDVVKVGVTRKVQVPTRWIDQGAVQAIKLAETPNRYLAGVIEVALKDVFVDKTNWRKMLMNQLDDSLDLVQEKWQCEELLPEDLSEYMVEDDTITELKYPVLKYPTSVKSIGFDKVSNVEKTLMGIKGQYLIFTDGSVLNIRKHEGYQVEIIG